MKSWVLFHLIISVLFITYVIAKRGKTKKSTQLGGDDENVIHAKNKREIDEKIAEMNKNLPSKLNTEHKLSKKDMENLEREEISTRKSLDASTKKQGKVSLERANLLHKLGNNE
jgi:hypothetical protein